MEAFIRWVVRGRLVLDWSLTLWTFGRPITVATRLVGQGLAKEVLEVVGAFGG